MPSSGRTSGACATSQRRPICRAAPCTGSSTRWSRQDLLAAAPHGRFRVGPVLVRTALILADRLDVTRVARPILDRVTAQTGETAILCLYAPARRQFWAVAAAESGHTIRYIWESLRDWNDLHVGLERQGDPRVPAAG